MESAIFQLDVDHGYVCLDRMPHGVPLESFHDELCGRSVSFSYGWTQIL